jgi:hypothetical protein
MDTWVPVKKQRALSKTEYDKRSIAQAQKNLQDWMRAEKTRRMDLLMAFTLGQHSRLGMASCIRTLSPDLVQMIMGRV